MPATKAYPRGGVVPKDSKMPEIRADRDPTKISGPGAAGERRTPAATASASTAALTPAASQARAGQRTDDSPAVTGQAGLTQQRPDSGQPLPALPDHRPASARVRPGHRAPPRPYTEKPPRGPVAA